MACESICQQLSEGERTIMDKRGKVRGYYLPEDQMKWLEEQAEKEKRSVSNFLARLIENAMASVSSKKQQNRGGNHVNSKDHR
jgi:hypothetical protein